MKLSTTMGEIPLPEYPRPQLRRDSYLCLNGLWTYTVQDGEEYTRQNTGTILVPYSPEAESSGCDFRLQTGETLWYERTFTLPEGFLKDRVLLHFGAVDQSCQVRINDRPAGRHEGGYLPFTLDITDFLISGENRVTVQVDDKTEESRHAFGRQSSRAGGEWHTAQSGIWQTVWLESVVSNYVENLRLTPDFDHSALVWKVEAKNPSAHLRVWEGERCIAEEHSTSGRGRVTIPEAHPWTPEDPWLYRVTVDLEDGDHVESYFGLRKFSTMEWKGHPVFALNNQPYFHHGVLDLGYWKDGLYTAPSDEAMCADLKAMKDLGFNTVRKTGKIEPLRWYYHCDRLGLLVWQDLPSGFDQFRQRTMTLPWAKFPRKDGDYKAFGRTDSAGRSQFEKDMEAAAALLYNSVCLELWTLFHEGWGQFDALRLCDRSVKLKGDGRRVLALSEVSGGEVSGLYDRQVLPYLEKEGLSAAIYHQWCDVEDEQTGLMTYDRRLCKADTAALKALGQKLKFDK